MTKFALVAETIVDNTCISKTNEPLERKLYRNVHCRKYKIPYFVPYINIKDLELLFRLIYNFRIKTMFGSSLPPVVCRRAHRSLVFTLFVFVCA